MRDTTVEMTDQRRAILVNERCNLPAPASPPASRYAPDPANIGELSLSSSSSLETPSAASSCLLCGCVDADTEE